MVIRASRAEGMIVGRSLPGRWANNALSVCTACCGESRASVKDRMERPARESGVSSSSTTSRSLSIRLCTPLATIALARSSAAMVRPGSSFSSTWTCLPFWSTRNLTTRCDSRAESGAIRSLALTCRTGISSIEPSGSSRSRASRIEVSRRTWAAVSVISSAFWAGIAVTEP